jgi:hypothetical protein
LFTEVVGMKTEDDGLMANFDHMTGTKVILLALVLYFLAALFATGLDMAIRSSNQNTAARIITRSLGTSSLALWPPGHPLNQPMAVHPGVELRLAPNLPKTRPGIY